ncbi:MAG: hypothetical protein U5L45_10035 [Saprospiraceae bacterium]|nr:hypothetical protein [Saprospiraceae bacterium]
MWFVFRLRRKTNHVSSLLRERSERKGVLLCVLEFYVWFENGNYKNQTNHSSD